MSTSGNPHAHKIIFTKNTPNTHTLQKNGKMWCLVCGKYDSEHLGKCTAKISLSELEKLIKEVGIAPGKPVEFPQATVLTFSSTKKYHSKL
ncbi:Protein of unknown function [Gryllus bimaculatus]|nr:Protein of unknown function [Gryllus bimaculatus]